MLIMTCRICIYKFILIVIKKISSNMEFIPHCKWELGSRKWCVLLFVCMQEQMPIFCWSKGVGVWKLFPWPLFRGHGLACRHVETWLPTSFILTLKYLLVAESKEGDIQTPLALHRCLIVTSRQTVWDIIVYCVIWLPVKIIWGLVISKL